MSSRAVAIRGLSAVAVLFAIRSACAATADFAPATGPAGGWGAVTTTANFLGLDGAGNVVLISKKGLSVDAMLIATHVQTKVPTKLTHFHYESDFTAAQKTQANDFWNWFFDTAGGKATKKTHATNTTNCYCTALGSIGNGTYAYWINVTPATTGFDDDTDPKDKATAMSGDVLFYSSQDHASILKTTEETTFIIRWKNNASGIYEYEATGLNTPGRTGLTLAVGKAPTGTWAADAIGSEANLDPDAKVRRKKP